MGDSKSGTRRSIPPGPAAAQDASGAAKQGVTVYTLTLLVDRHGRVEPSRVDAYVVDASAASLVADGHRVATSRVVQDGTRILGAAGAFLAVATPAQREEMPLIDEAFLAAAVTSVERADTAQRALDANRSRSLRDRHLAKGRGDAAVLRARRRRDTLHQALLTLAGGDPEQRQQVFDATGAAETPDDVADALARQVALGQQLVRAAKARGVVCALDKAYFAKTLEMAEEGRAFGAEARAPASMDGIHQGEVDRLDGVALWFLKRVVDSFDAAHEADPSIPRLQVRALRGVLGRGTRKKKPAAQPAPTPTPTPR